MEHSTVGKARQVNTILDFPLQPEIAHQRAVDSVRELQLGNLDVDTSADHLGPYADSVEWIRHAVSITRGRPC